MSETERFNIKEYLQCEKVGFIGAGNIARAIAGGLISKGLVSSTGVYASAPSDNNLIWWKGQGAHTTHSNGDIVENCGVIFLAVKPQYLTEAVSSISKIPRSKLVVSVLAGVELETLEEVLISHFDSPRVVRILPNTPLHVASGCTVFCGGKSASKDDLQIVQGMLTPCGMCVEVKESMMNVAGAVSGCGPAFMYIILEALADGAVKMGLPRELAQILAAQTMSGAAQMVLQTGRHPGQLKDEVCSPAGTTIAGVSALEKHAVRSAMIAAVEAATTRSFEMSRKK